MTDYSDRFRPPAETPNHPNDRNFIVEKRWIGGLLYVLVDTPGFHGFRVRGKLPSGNYIHTCEIPYDGQSLQWFIDNAELKEDR